MKADGRDKSDRMCLKEGVEPGKAPLQPNQAPVPCGVEPPKPPAPPPPKRQKT